MPRHVIPVDIAEPEGCVVPIACTPSDDWDASDACSRFLFEQNDNPLRGLEMLLRQIETAWPASAGILPLRWRRAYSISILIPVHIGDIAGDSMHLPMAVMILREICASFSGALPFGDGPVFCTGPINPDGSFDGACAIREKLAGFRRELGPKRCAILSSKQKSRIGAKLLDGMTVYPAENLRELLQIGPIEQGLRQLAARPHDTEIDHLTRLMKRLERGVRFSDALSLGDYLLKHEYPEPYRVRVLTATAHLLLHEGKTLAADRYLDDAEALLSAAGADPGVDDRIHYHAVRGIHLLDSGAPEAALVEMEKAKVWMPHGSHLSRIEVRGTKCQAYRACKEYDKAIREGLRAVWLAKRGFASETGRDLNYVTHALIAKAWARSDAARRRAVKQAQFFLDQSSVAWAPAEPSRVAVHRLFCRHYEAEIKRLSGAPFAPGTPADVRAGWRHPWLFTLLSCSRNEANDLSDRQNWALQLVEESAKLAGAEGERRKVFELFHRVYRVWSDAIHGIDFHRSRDELTDWCNAASREGMTGWRNILAPLFLESPETPEARIAWADRLCSAIYFH